MADEFDYVKPTRPMPKETMSAIELLNSMVDLENEEMNFVGCFFGEAGCGKTTTVMQFAQLITPPDQKILYYGTNQGYSSLKNFPELMKRTKLLRYTNADQFESLVEQFGKPAVRAATKIGTIVFDEHNTMFDIETERITSTRAAQLWQDKHQFKDPDTPEWPDYSSAKVKLINSLNHVLGLDDLNLIFACHPRTGKKSFKIEPDYFDKAAQSFLRVMHSVYYMEATEVEGPDKKMVTRRTIRTQGTDQIVAKNRIGKLPNVVRDVKPIAEAYLQWRVGKLTEKNPSVSVAVEVEKSTGETADTEGATSNTSDTSNTTDTDSLLDMLNI